MKKIIEVEFEGGDEQWKTLLVVEKDGKIEASWGYGDSTTPLPISPWLYSVRVHVGDVHIRLNVDPTSPSPQ